MEQTIGITLQRVINGTRVIHAQFETRENKGKNKPRESLGPTDPSRKRGETSQEARVHVCEATDSILVTDPPTFELYACQALKPYMRDRREDNNNHTSCLARDRDVLEVACEWVCS